MRTIWRCSALFLCALTLLLAAATFDDPRYGAPTVGIHQAVRIQACASQRPPAIRAQARRVVAPPLICALLPLLLALSPLGGCGAPGKEPPKRLPLHRLGHPHHAPPVVSAWGIGHQRTKDLGGTHGYFASRY